MIKPKAINNDEFYFYNGYIIRLRNDYSYYNLYKLHYGGSSPKQNKEDLLSRATNKVDELNKEYEQEIQQEIKIEKFIKRFKPYFKAIATELYKSIGI